MITGEGWIRRPACTWSAGFRRASDLAAQREVNAAALSRYCLEPLPRGGLLFGYASTSESDMEIGARRLARAWRQL